MTCLPGCVVGGERRREKRNLPRGRGRARRRVGARLGGARAPTRAATVAHAREKNPRWVLAEAHLWSSSSCDAKVTCSGSMSISSIERVALPVTATAETAAPPRAPAAPKPRRPTAAKATVDGPAAASAPAATRARAGAPPAPREAYPPALEARATGPPLQPGASPARAASAPARAHAIMLGASVVLDRSGRETERGREVPTLVGVSRAPARRPFTASWRGFRRGGSCGGRGRTKAIRTRSKAQTLDRRVNILDKARTTVSRGNRGVQK